MAEVARQAGHSVEECLRTYVHVFEEFDPGEHVPAEEAIRGARSQSGVSVVCPADSVAEAGRA